MAQILGAALGTWIVAALISWILRKVATIGYVLSYLIGFVCAVPIASVLYSFGRDDLKLGPFDAVPVYALGALIGFALTIGTYRYRSRKKISN